MTAPKMELRRTRQELPDDAGWFYGRWKETPWAPIKPYFVTGSHQVRVLTKRGLAPIADFDWFGEVPTCIESGE